MGHYSDVYICIACDDTWNQRGLFIVTILKLDKIEHNWVPIQTFNMGCKVLENYLIKLYCGSSTQFNLGLYISDKYWSFSASSWSKSNVLADWNEIYRVFVEERSQHVDLFSNWKERFSSINTSWGNMIFGKCHCVKLGQVRLYVKFSYCDNYIIINKVRGTMYLNNLKETQVKGWCIFDNIQSITFTQNNETLRLPKDGWI